MGPEAKGKVLEMKLRFVPFLLLLAAAFALPGTTKTTKAEEAYTLRTTLQSQLVEAPSPSEAFEARLI